MFVFDNRAYETPRHSLFLSSGLGNSICVTGTEPVIYQYNITSVYNPNDQGLSVRYNDPNLAIPWPILNPVVNPTRDLKLPFLRDLFPEGVF